jgi:hypothetical protein
MHQRLKITAAGLVVALAAGPAVAQGGATPKQEQQAPRNTGSGQSGPNQPGTPSTESSPSTPETMKDGSTLKGGAIRPENMSRGTMRDGNTLSRDSATGSDDGMRATKANTTQVRQVQEALKAQGHDPGPIDGVMGPQTQEALRAYQRSQNLTETGRLDAQTSEKLGVGGASSGSPSR